MDCVPFLEEGLDFFEAVEGGCFGEAAVCGAAGGEGVREAG